MLYRGIIAVYSEIHTRQINTLSGQNVEFVNVKTGCIHKVTTRSLYVYNQYFMCFQRDCLLRARATVLALFCSQKTIVSLSLQARCLSRTI